MIKETLSFSRQQLTLNRKLAQIPMSRLVKPQPNIQKKLVDFVAIALISQATECFDLLGVIKKAVFPLLHEEPPNITDWLPLYYSHRKVKSVFSKFLATMMQSHNMLESFAEALVNQGSRSISHCFSQNDQNMTIPSQAEECLFRPEFSFILKVVIPSLFFYQKLPFFLYREARLGKASALNKILRLDKAVICDRRIAFHFYQSSTQKNKLPFHNMVVALKGSPQEKLSLQRVKYVIASIVSIMSEKLGSKLSSTEIRELFNRYSDNACQNSIDEDLPPSEEAFAKAIQRERPIWEDFVSDLVSFLNPDKI